MKKLKKQITNEAYLILERIQPFQRLRSDVEGSPEADLLVLLQIMNNIDKHKIPNVILLLPQGTIEHNFSVEFYSELDAALNVPPKIHFYISAIESNTRIMSQITNKPIKKVEGKLTYPATVCIGYSGKRDKIDLIKRLHLYTKLIVNQFEFLFEE